MRNVIVILIYKWYETEGIRIILHTKQKVFLDTNPAIKNSASSCNDGDKDAFSDININRNFVVGTTSGTCKGAFTVIQWASNHVCHN